MKFERFYLIVGLVLALLLVIAMALSTRGAGAQSPPPVPQGTDQSLPTYRGAFDGYLWFSWEPGSLSYTTAFIDVVVDGQPSQRINLTLYDPILPQLWWRTRIPRGCDIQIWRGFIGLIPIEGLPVELNLHCIYLPILLVR